MVDFTPGPWAWFGNRSGGVYLATPDRGRRYVMGFRRYGMNGAQPTFSIGSIMHPAAELVSFAVGEKTVRGFKDADGNSSVYRYDVSGIDHPDARLIAAAPELLAALVKIGLWVEQVDRLPLTAVHNIADAFRLYGAPAIASATDK